MRGAQSNRGQQAHLASRSQSIATDIRGRNQHSNGHQRIDVDGAHRRHGPASVLGSQVPPSWSSGCGTLGRDDIALGPPAGCAGPGIEFIDVVDDAAAVFTIVGPGAAVVHVGERSQLKLVVGGGRGRCLPNPVSHGRAPMDVSRSSLRRRLCTRRQPESHVSLCPA